MEKLKFTEKSEEYSKPEQHDPDQLWKILKEQLRLYVSDEVLGKFYKNGCIEKLENGVLYISIENETKREYIEGNHSALIKNIIHNTVGYRPELAIRLAVATIAQVEPSNSDKYLYFNPYEAQGQESMFNRQQPSSATAPIKTFQSNLNPKYQIDNFIVGESNGLAYAVAENVIQNLGTAYNPLFYYGPSGVGKTHLMQAVGNAILEKDPTKKVIYVPIETFMNEMIDAIRLQKNDEFRSKYREVDLLIIDDIQFISSKQKTKEELFNTFNALYEKNKQIILASDRPPKEIENLPERLRTRFEGGMVMDMHIPDYESRIAIIQQRVSESKVDIPADSIEVIAQNFKNSVRELEGAVNKIISHSRLLGKSLSDNDINSMLKIDIESKRKRITPEKIIDAVCEVFEVTVKDIRGKKRTAYLAMARQVIMYMLREDLEYPLGKAAAEVNRKDHTTVLYACQKVELLMKKDSRFAGKVERCRQLCG